MCGKVPGAWLVVSKASSLTGTGRQSPLSRVVKKGKIQDVKEA